MKTNCETPESEKEETVLMKNLRTQECRGTKMECTKCGNPIPQNEVKCTSCGATNEPAAKAVTYDYRTVDANQKNALEVVDCYEALGWELANKNDSYVSSAVSLSFKRSRKIKNKDQLNRLQLKLDDSLCGIGVLEKRKTQKAGLASIVMGVIGTLIFGGGMCICMLLPFSEIVSYTVGSIVAAAGAAVAGPAYPVYKKIAAKSASAMNVLIDKKRDEISLICEDAQGLLS